MPGDCRREQSVVIINTSKVVKQIEGAVSIDSVCEAPFELDLPQGCPSSFFYAGEMLSVVSALYSIKLAVTAKGDVTKEICSTTQMITVRAVDHIPRPFSLEREAPIPAVFGSNGTTKALVSMDEVRVQQGNTAQVRVGIDNSQGKKKVIGGHLRLRRTMKFSAVTAAGEASVFEDTQVVLEQSSPMIVAVKEPQVIAHTLSMPMVQVVGAVNNKERHRFWLSLDLDTGYTLSQEVMNLQKTVLPTMKTPLINVSYVMEVSITHDGAISSS